MKTRAITEGAMMAAITVIIALLSYFIPFFSILSYFLLPLPTTILYKQQGGIVAAISSVAATIILFFFMDPVNALLIGAVILLPGILIGHSYKEDESGGRRIITGYVAYLAAILIEVVLFERVSGTNVVEDFVNEINSSIKIIDDFYSTSGSFDAEQLKQFKDLIAQQGEQLKMLFPSIIVISPAFLSWITVLIDDYFFKRSKQSYKPVKPMTEWYLTNPAKILLALVTFISVIAQQFITDPVYALYPYTAVTIVNLIYLLMGLSFVFWLIKRRFHKNMYLWRVIVLVLMLFFSGLGFIITLVGIFDVYINLRRFFEK